MKVRYLIVLVILVLVSSCGEYEKLLKSTDFEMKKVKAKEYYEKGQYVKCTELLAQILPRYRATDEAEELNWMNAQAFYGMKDFVMAGSYYKSFIDQFPFGTHIEEASFMSPMCDFQVSPRAALDQESARSAIEGFAIFMTRFPASSRVEESKKLTKQLQEVLVEKSYLSAKLYYDMKQYKASTVALNNSLKEYADTKYREEMMFLKLNSLFLFAEKSLFIKQKERYQDTLDDYFSFMEEFPESKYSKEVNNIYQKTNKFLKIEVPVSGAE